MVSKQRAIIAKRLGHRIFSGIDRCFEYGRFKSENYEAWKTFLKNHPKQV